MKHIQRIKEQKEFIQKNIGKMSRYYELQKKYATDSQSMSQEEHFEIFTLQNHFEEKLPKAYTAIAKTQEATKALLQKLESMEAEYQTILVEGDKEEMQTKMQTMQTETENRIDKMFSISRELITRAESEDDKVPESETIVSLLFKVAKKMVN